MISLSNVTVLDPHSARPVLEAFDLTVEKGELAVLLGEGDSGKTTVLQLISSERRPESGEVLANGVSVDHLKGNDLIRFRRNLGIVPQNVSLLDDRSVESHIELPLEIDGMKTDRRKGRVKAILDRFGLIAVREKLPSSLSMSERTRTAIAMAVVREPFLLLADEPAAHLDARSAMEIAELLLHENLRGMTVLIATSDERFAAHFPEVCIRRMGILEPQL